MIWILTERWDDGSLILGAYRTEAKALEALENEAKSNVAFSKPENVKRHKRSEITYIHGMGASLMIESYKLQG